MIKKSKTKIYICLIMLKVIEIMNKQYKTLNKTNNNFDEN